MKSLTIKFWACFFFRRCYSSNWCWWCLWFSFGYSFHFFFLTLAVLLLLDIFYDKCYAALWPYGHFIQSIFEWISKLAKRFRPIKGNYKWFNINHFWMKRIFFGLFHDLAGILDKFGHIFHLWNTENFVQKKKCWTSYGSIRKLDSIVYFIMEIANWYRTAVTFRLKRRRNQLTSGI